MKRPQITAIVETVLYQRAIELSEAEFHALIRSVRSILNGRKDEDLVVTAVGNAVHRFEYRQAGISDGLTDEEWLARFEEYNRRKAERFESRANEAFGSGDTDAGNTWTRLARESRKFAKPWRTLKWDAAAKEYA